MKVAILGTGNIGTDLLMKIRNRSESLEVALFAGIDPGSVGIARARALGVPTTTNGVEGVLADPEIPLVFDATSASAHLAHAPLLEDAGKVAVDLTPAAVGPFVVPAVRCAVGEERNVNLVSCGGQAVIQPRHRPGHRPRPPRGGVPRPDQRPRRGPPRRGRRRAPAGLAARSREGRRRFHRQWRRDPLWRGRSPPRRARHPGQQQRALPLRDPPR